MSKKQNFRKVTYLLLTLFLLVITILSGQDFLPVFAETTTYTSVIEDLRKDSSFNFMDYPDVPNDYSIQVIQIAESTDGELFIYTYQPCQATLPLVATEINMSLSDEMGGVVDMTSQGVETSTDSSDITLDNFWSELLGVSTSNSTTKLYELTCISTWGVFGKYKVKNFKVSNETERFYNISSIYRNRDKIADGIAGVGSSAIAYSVGKCWSVKSANGELSYSMKTVGTITITDCYYGTIRIPEGQNFWSSYACDMHIIAFDTDIKMDELLEADVAFKYRYVEKGLYDNDYDGWKSKQVTVTYEEQATSKKHLFHSSQKTWDRIQRGWEFVDNCSKSKIDLPADVQRTLWEKRWVLAFWETEYENLTGGTFGWLTWVGSIFGANYKNYTQVKDATVIRLEFIKDGKTYNLGAVSNKTDDYAIIGGEDKTFWSDAKEDVDKFFDKVWDKVKGFFGNLFGSLPWWVWLIIGLVALAILLPILSVVFPVFGTALKTIFNALWTAIKCLFKGLWWLICLPFRGIKALINKFKGE